MKLYIAPGACSLSPHIVIRELGLPFELEGVDLHTKTTASGVDFISINAKGTVPALELDDGEVLTEGVAIIQFLADHYALGQLAAAGGTVERARLTAHLNFIASEFHPAFGVLFNPATLPDTRVTTVAIIGRKFAVMEAALSDGRRYLLGENFSLADAYLFVMITWAPIIGLDLATWPRVQRLGESVNRRAAVQAALQAETQIRLAA